MLQQAPVPSPVVVVVVVVAMIGVFVTATVFYARPQCATRMLPHLGESVAIGSRGE